MGTIDTLKYFNECVIIVLTRLYSPDSILIMDNKPKDKNLNIRIDEHTITLLRVTAKKQRRTTSNLVLKYIDEGIKRDSRKRPK